MTGEEEETQQQRRRQQQQLCRLCAEPKQQLLGIYEAEGLSLAIESKIVKCLRIQIFPSDNLPLCVCEDCCKLLNQSSEFFDKTNQAQCSLRHMLNNCKEEIEQENLQNTSSLSSEANVAKEESCEGDSEAGIDQDFLDSSNDASVKEELQENVIEAEEDGNKSPAKKGSPKQNNKKKVKRKNSSSKLNDCEQASDELDKEQSKEESGKTSVKIPENYMTGTESDMDIIRSGKKENAEQPANKSRRRGERLERYPWLCTDCNDKLPSLEMLEEHHQTIHNQKAKYMCVQCCKVYEKYYGFLTHVKRHKNKPKFSCEDCGKTFVHKKVLDTHKAVHSEERPHVCQTCGKAFRQQSALYIHSRCHLPESMKNRFPCDQCDKSFSTKPNLVTHKRIHSGVRNFTCDQCGKSFIQKGNLEAHFLTHSAEKPYTCTQCNKSFKTTLQLKKHETVHTGAKPHQCAVCGRTFREKGTLREHHRIHTGAMPFSCEFCGKSFRFKGILTTHRRQHTGERPYSCMECQHHFTNWPNYNKHMKRRHGINTSQQSHPLPTQPSQQQQQEAQQNLQALQQQVQAVQVQVQTASGTQQTVLTPVQITATTVQVIHPIPHVTVTRQPIVLQALPSNTPVTAIETFIEGETGSSSRPLVSGTVTRTQQQQQPQQQQQQAPAAATTAYFNALATPVSTFVPANVPYNFYNVSQNAAGGAGAGDAVHHR